MDLIHKKFNPKNILPKTASRHANNKAFIFI